MIIKKQKGTVDQYGEVGYTKAFLTSYLHSFMQLYNYQYIDLPTYESTELFCRGVGDGTDIVNKEMFTFDDKGGRNISLRPEMTASLARCIIEDKLYTEETIINKFYYIGSCFRYERPQSGRLREFTQYGVEAFGTKNPALDAEIISIGYKFLSNIGIDNMIVKLNTLGDKESRSMYREALMKHLEKDIDSLCDDCKERYKKNPLRILDCKIDGDKDIIKNAPKTIDYLNKDSKEFFDKLIKCLEDMNIPYELDSGLVRGLDYYSHTVFEIVSELDDLGTASTICGGGRYDDLIETIGGPSTPGVGFAMGLERIIKIIESENIVIDKPKIDLYIMNLSETNEAYKLLNELRDLGYNCEIDYRGKNMKGMYKQVDRLDPEFILIIGEDEIKGDFITVKDNRTKESEQVKKSDLFDYLNSWINNSMSTLVSKDSEE